jgi:hypothetical protein
MLLEVRRGFSRVPLKRHATQGYRTVPSRAQAKGPAAPPPPKSEVALNDLGDDASAGQLSRNPTSKSPRGPALAGSQRTAAISPKPEAETWQRALFQSRRPGPLGSPDPLFAHPISPTRSPKVRRGHRPQCRESPPFPPFPHPPANPFTALSSLFFAPFRPFLKHLAFTPSLQPQKRLLGSNREKLLWRPLNRPRLTA